jgi:hypothetical protein
MSKIQIALIALGIIVGMEAVISLVLLRQVSQLKQEHYSYPISEPYPTESAIPIGLAPTITPSLYATPYPTYNPRINPMPSYMLTIYPTESVNNLPTDIQDAYSWPIQQLCAIPKTYNVYYQLDDGSNIYKVSTGGYVRGKPMLCTN